MSSWIVQQAALFTPVGGRRKENKYFETERRNGYEALFFVAQAFAL